MSLLLRIAGRDHLPAIVALRNAAFRSDKEQQGWSTESAYITGDRTSESLLLEEMSDHTRLLVVAGQATSKLDGCVSLKPISAEKR